MESEIEELRRQAFALSTGKGEASFQLCTDVIAMVRNSTRRIQDHVKEIADCVKGLGSPPHFAPCHLAPIVSSVFETLKWMADEHGVTLSAKGLDGLPGIVADERRLFNAFYNLVNNAVPEMPAGGSVTVSGQADPKSHDVLITVADTGCGMPPEVLHRLFTPAAQSRKPGGTGLGTKIVKDVVDAHGGTVRVESTVGQGTTFYLRLPVNAAKARKRRGVVS